MKKTILITGATDGIGLLTAQKLASAGHHILIHGRNKTKTEALAKNFKDNDHQATSFIADLSVFSDIDQLADQIEQQCPHLDIIINNAGVYQSNESTNAENIDLRFMVNTIAPYRLSTHLLPKLNRQSRIINVTSAAQTIVNEQALLGNVTLETASYAYAQSKLATNMWTRYLANTLGEQAPILVAVNPGSLLASKMVKEGFGIEGKDLNIGADILVQASLDQSFAQASGKYFDNDLQQFSDPHPYALDDKNCKKIVDAIELLLAQHCP